MARLTYEQMQQAVIEALPSDGSHIAYQDLIAALDAAGAAMAADAIRDLKHRGQITMTVRMGENGPIHEVSRAS